MVFGICMLSLQPVHQSLSFFSPGLWIILLCILEAFWCVARKAAWHFEHVSGCSTEVSCAYTSVVGRLHDL